MSGTDELARLYSSIEEAAGLLDVACSREKVWPILTAFGDALPQAVIAFRVATGAQNEGELDCRFMMLPRDLDPYARAVERGLLPETDHPSGSVLTELQGRFPIDCYGIDFGVVAGFTKSWTFFPADDMQRLSALAELPSMPRSMGENLDFFARYDLEDKGSLIGIDHPDRTMNVYFGTPPAACFQPENIAAILRELGLPEPSEQLLKLGQEAFGIYVTLSWDSPKVERVTFAVMTPDPMALPVHIDPKIEKFVREAPHDPDDRRCVYAIASTPRGEYHKLQSYLRWRPRMLNVMLLSDSVEDLV